MSKLYNKYPKTKMFRIIDMIGMPHKYHAGAPHKVHALIHKLHRLSTAEQLILSFERKTGKGECMVEGCNLTFAEHKTALVVEVNFKGELQDAPGLQKYLKKCESQARLDDAQGFVYIQKQEKNEVS